MVVPAIEQDDPPQRGFFNVTLLLAALVENALPVAEYLVDQGANVNVVINQRGMNVLHAARMYPDRLDFLKLFLTRGKADMRAMTAQGTLLHEGVYGPHQSLEYIKFLLPYYDGPAFAGPHFSHHDFLTQEEFSHYDAPAHMLDTTLRTIVSSDHLFAKEGLQEAIVALFLGARACPI